MADIQFQQFLEAFSLGLTNVYEDNLKQHKKTYPEILREEQAKHWFDTDWLTSGLGAMPLKEIGAAISTDRILKAPTKQFELQAFALATTIDHEALEWDLYGVFSGLPQELAKSAVDRYNVLGYSVYNNSFSAPSADYEIYSGENMISATHARLDGGTWSNSLTGNPSIAYLALQDVIINLSRLVNERGRFVVLEAKHIICAPEQAWVAREVIQSPFRNDVAAATTKNLLRDGMSVHTSPYLTAVQSWWALSDKKDLGAFMRLGKGPMLKRDQDIRTLAFVMVSYMSCNIAVFDSRGLIGSTGGA